MSASHPDHLCVVSFVFALLGMIVDVVPSPPRLGFEWEKKPMGSTAAQRAHNRGREMARKTDQAPTADTPSSWRFVGEAGRGRIRGAQQEMVKRRNNRLEGVVKED